MKLNAVAGAIRPGATRVPVVPRIADERLIDPEVEPRHVLQRG